jgi:8-oxo-dGTP pyrophosphatase MutT (NUDIX family)
MNSRNEPSRWEALTRTSLTKTRIFDVHSARFRHPVRATERDFVVIDAPDWVNVVALTPDHQVVLVRQFRFGTKEFSLEIPGGVIEAGEEPLIAGVRELREETGYTGAPARQLGRVHPNPAIQSNRCHFVFVEQAVKTTPLAWDADEEIQVMTLPVEEVLGLARAGAISHSLVLSALLMFEPVWQEIRQERR